MIDIEKKNKQVRFTVYGTPFLKKLIESRCKEMGISASELFKQGVKREISVWDYRKEGKNDVNEV